MENKKIFTDEELEIYKHIRNSVTEDISSVEAPTAIVLGGQPGAGKSSIYKTARKRFNGNIAELDIDKFRKFHPNAEELAKDPMTYGEKTHPFVSAVVDSLVEELGKENYNMIIESPMKSTGTAFWVHDTLTPLGYTVEAHIMATQKEVSWQSTLDRYEDDIKNGELPRYVPKEYHDMCAENVASALSEVYESGKMANIMIYNRDGEILYDMSKDPEHNPTSILQEKIHGKEKMQSLSLSAQTDKLSMRANQTDRLKLSETSKSKLQLRECALSAKPQSKAKNEIER